MRIKKSTVAAQVVEIIHHSIRGVSYWATHLRRLHTVFSECKAFSIRLTFCFILKMRQRSHTKGIRPLNDYIFATFLFCSHC